ncbi:RluA family pseudouridine synthase [Alkaliphilus sp. B6464]|uniref:RluA family pseudouridine synthase n=1 Tax=Alkaliphilus sp. B6464 TaxID=2731219 RepID=UPI001BA80FDA|nr:RluA family pseudouridine synthase [Alkaliphilus sp. B6464]QUH21179.1 RluA family pseudouridine synthase [Alkaliphilus sp. B6464]
MILESKQKEDIIIYDAEYEDDGKELKQVLKGRLDFSSRLLSKLKRSKNVFINGEYNKYHETVKDGDEIKIVMDEESNHFIPQDIPFEVAYEDVDLILVNKQPGIVTHPTKSHPDNTIANAASWYLRNKGVNCKIRFVNRLDMDTSGLLVIAKNAYSHHVLSQQMQEDKIEKKYIAFVWGVIKEDKGRIEAPIHRTSADSIKRIVDENGQDSITEFKVLERYKNATMLEVKLLTGRTHQIRVHMEHIGHALIGDTLYGKDDGELIGRQALHAKYLYFLQPRYRKEVEVEASLPEDLIELRSKLQNM